MYHQSGPYPSGDRGNLHAYPRGALTVVSEIGVGVPDFRVQRADGQDPYNLDIRNDWDPEMMSLPGRTSNMGSTTAESYTLQPLSAFWSPSVEHQEPIDSESSNAFLLESDFWGGQGAMTTVAEAPSMFPPSFEARISSLTEDIFGVEFLTNMEVGFGDLEDAFDRVGLAADATARTAGVFPREAIRGVEEVSGELELPAPPDRVGSGRSGWRQDGAGSRWPPARAILPNPLGLTPASASQSTGEDTSASPASRQSASPRGETGATSRGRKG